MVISSNNLVKLQADQKLLFVNLAQNSQKNDDLDTKNWAKNKIENAFLIVNKINLVYN
jgi:hypothetical protein